MSKGFAMAHGFYGSERGSLYHGGYELRYAIEGSGIPTIVIGSAVYYSRSFSQNLRNSLRLAFVDWRGFAETATSVDPDSVSLEVLLDDIEAIREQIGFTQAVIIGHSAHALLALEYVKRYPERASHVVMIGISPNLSDAHAKAAMQNWEECVWPDRKRAFKERLQKLPDEELAILPPDQRFISWYVRRDPQAWFDYRFDSTHLWEGTRLNMPLFDFLYGVALRDLDITRDLHKLVAPVFLALGRSDFIVAPPSSWDTLRPYFQDLTVRVFEHSGHSPQYEEAVFFDEELLRWIATHNRVQ